MSCCVGFIWFRTATGESTSFLTNLLANAPEFEDAISVVTPPYKNHSVPDAKVVDARNDEHATWGILLEMLVLDGKTIVFQRLKFRGLYFTVIGTFQERDKRS